MRVGWKLFSISRPDCETVAPFGHCAAAAAMVVATLSRVAPCPSPSMVALSSHFATLKVPLCCSKRKKNQEVHGNSKTSK